MHPITKICCILLLTQLYSPGQAQTVFLQPERIVEGDIAKLVIELDSKIPSLYALDLAELEADFEVLEVKSGIARMLEANEMFHRMQWKIELLPRRSGSLSIPSIKVGGVSTPVLSLEVTRQSPASLARQDVFFEIEAQPQNPYVGQPARITIRLLHNIPISDGNMLEPGADNMEVYRSRRDSRYLINRNGREFNVLEQSIALVAQSPGVIRLSPANYRGTIKQESASTSANPAVPSRRIYRNSEALQLQVRNPPAAFSGSAWLPARQLEISQRWDAIADDLKVGDSLGLNLTIEAWGLPAEALPSDLINGYSDKFKIYADQEVRSNRFQNNDLVGRLEQRFAIVISQPGEITLPATILKWWDITRDIERVALLESRKLSVINSTDTQSGIADLSRHGSNLSPAAGPEFTSIRGNWLWIALLSLPLMACMALFFVTSARRRTSRKIESVLATRRNLQALKKACLMNDPLIARRELLKWGRRRWPGANINGVNQIEARTNSTEFSTELSRLDRALYARQDSSWQGRRLWQLVTTEAPCYPAGFELDENSLPNLYPQQDLSTR
jgi:hypothetical protein